MPIFEELYRLARYFAGGNVKEANPSYNEEPPALLSIVSQFETSLTALPEDIAARYPDRINDILVRLEKYKTGKYYDQDHKRPKAYISTIGVQIMNSLVDMILDLDGRIKNGIATDEEKALVSEWLSAEMKSYKLHRYLGETSTKAEDITKLYDIPTAGEIFAGIPSIDTITG